MKPIAHLYKSQVYALSAHLGVPTEIQARQPTTDTYSLAQSQEEFYFSLPWDKMDLCLYGLNHGVPAETIGAASACRAKRWSMCWPISPPSAAPPAICTRDRCSLNRWPRSPEAAAQTVRPGPSAFPHARPGRQTSR